MAQVCLDGAFGDIELLGNFLVAGSGSNGKRHFALAWAQLLKSGSGLWPHATTMKPQEQASHQVGAHPQAAIGDDCLDLPEYICNSQCSGIACGTRFEYGQPFIVARDVGQDDHGATGGGFPQGFDQGGGFPDMIIDMQPQHGLAGQSQSCPDGFIAVNFRGWKCFSPTGQRDIAPGEKYMFIHGAAFYLSVNATALARSTGFNR